MARSQSFFDWQDAEAVAEAAQQAVSRLIRSGCNPIREQLEEVLALRHQASEKLRALVADVKARASCNAR